MNRFAHLPLCIWPQLRKLKNKKIQKLINCGQMQSKKISKFGKLIYKTYINILLKNHNHGLTFSVIICQ